MLRRAGQSGVAGALWVGGLALVGAMFAYALFDAFHGERSGRRTPRHRGAGRGTDGALAGAGLGAGLPRRRGEQLVEDACERPLFASPEAVAAAVAYVDARLSLLAASAALAERDPSYQPVVERLRRGLEADRYGLVAHVLTTRGCNGADCAELRLLRDPARVVANMKSRAFEASLGAHALGLAANGPGAAAAAIAAAAAAGNHRRRAANAGAGVRLPPPAGAPGYGQVRLSLGQLDPGGQHHEPGARRAAGRPNRGPRRAPKRAAARRPAARPRARRPPAAGAADAAAAGSAAGAAAAARAGARRSRAPPELGRTRSARHPLSAVRIAALARTTGPGRC